MSRPAVITLGVGVACALHFAVTEQVVVPGLAVLMAMVGTLVGPRVALAQAAQALVLVASALLVLGAALVDVPLGPKEGGPQLQHVVASGAALWTMGQRLWMTNPERGDRATWAIGLVVFYCCGRVVSAQYLPLAVAYLGLAWLHTALVAGLQSHRSRRHVAGGLTLVVGTLGLGGGTIEGLRRAYVGISTLVIARAGSGEVGFGAGTFQLGSMDGLRDSDEVILRVHGPVAEHLRGQAYSEYAGGVWFPPGGAVPVALGPEPAGEVTTIEFVAEGQERLFLPARSGALVVSPPGVLVDALGVPRPVKEVPREVRFDSAGAPRIAPADPTPEDLALPSEVAATIGPLVNSWIAGAPTPRARVDAIRAALERDYTYSLHYERDAHGDPVVQFMTTSRLGHCEYFASAMALGARSAGVPARVVTGFRSSETSPFGGHRIVRGRDAHAWVEVHLDGAWALVDPSPQNSLVVGPTRSLLAGALDDLAVFWQRHGLQGLAVLLLVVFVGLQVRTLLRGRRPPGPAASEAWIEGPPPWLLPLLDRLMQAGLVREDAEPIEVFAARVHAAGEAEAGSLLRRYAAWRYGGLGGQAALAGEVDHLLRRPGGAAEPRPDRAIG